MLQTLGQKIRAARKEAGLTQQALAGADFTPGFISQLENDLVRPSLRSLEVLARRLGKPLNSFLAEPGEAVDPQTLDLAEKLLESERLEEAAALLAPVEAALAELQQGKARALRLVGTLQIRSGDAEQGFRMLQAAAELATAEDALETAKLQNALAIANDRLQRWSEALAHLQEAVSLLNSSAEVDSVVRLKIETNMCIVLCRLKRYEEARAVGDGLLQGARTSGLQYRLPELLHTLGVAYFRTGESERALACYAISRELYTLFGDRHMLAGVLTNTGIVQGALGQYEAACGSFRAAAQAYRELGAPAELANAHLEQAKCAHAAGDLALALTAAEAALAGPLPDPSQAEALEVAASCREARGQAEAALDAYRRAAELFAGAGERPAAARVARTVGLLLTRIGRPDEGVLWLEQAISLLAPTA